MRQGAQLGAGSLQPVFHDAASYAPAPGPTYSSPWDDSPYPGQRTAGYGPPEQDYGYPEPEYAQQRHASAPLSLSPQYVEHDPNAAARLGEYKEPHLASYGRTSDTSDVVRQFQAQMNGGGWATSYSPTGPGGMDPSAGAQAFLSRTAGRNYSPAEQLSLEQESHVLGARNLGELDLNGTHYLE